MIQRFAVNKDMAQTFAVSKDKVSHICSKQNYGLKTGSVS